MSELQLSSMPTIVSGSNLNAHNSDTETSTTNDAAMVASLMVPPNYGNHVYDRVYGETTNQNKISTPTPPIAIEPQVLTKSKTCISRIATILTILLRHETLKLELMTVITVTPTAAASIIVAQIWLLIF